MGLHHQRNSVEHGLLRHDHLSRDDTPDDPVLSVLLFAISAEHLGQGPAFFAAADQHGLEGIVSKRADSRYISGREKTWLKVKSFTIGDYAVLGVERSSTGIPIALLASLGREPAYVGNAMVTLPDSEKKAFWSSIERMGTPQARLAGLPRNKNAKWISEGLVARVRHLRGEDMLRHATLKSMNTDKPLQDDLGDRHADGE